MRKLLRNSKKRSGKKKEEDVAAIHSMRAVEPDADIAATAHGNRLLIEDGESAIKNPEAWAKEKRTSLNRNRPRSSHSTATGASNITGSHVSSGATSSHSRADIDDIYSDDVAVESILNPDVEHQIDADSDDFDALDLPRPGTTEKAPRTRTLSALSQTKSSTNKRLSSRLGKFLGMGRSAMSPRAASSSISSVPASPKGKDKKFEKDKKSTKKRESKRISFRLPGSSEKNSLAKSEKLRAKQAKKEEERRLREIRMNPWYPAGVDFKYLSPKSTWIPFLGRDSSTKELDFGDEARLIGSNH